MTALLGVLGGYALINAAVLVGAYALLRDTRLDGTRQVPPAVRLIPQGWRWP